MRGPDHMTRAIPLLVTLLTITGLAFAGPTSASDIETDGTLKQPGLHVDPQVTNGSLVTVSRVNANESLWLVIHADANGTFGAVLGNSEVLDEGLHVGVDVEVDLQNETENDTVRLHAMLHHDDGDGEYGFPDSDPPMTDANGEIIVHAFNVSVENDPVVVATGPAEMAGGDAADILDLDNESTVEIATARLARDGYVVVHADANGAPGEVVGQSDLLEAGEHEDVEVPLDQAALSLNGTSTVLWAMVHIDDGDGVYMFPGPDTPVTVGGTPVMTPFPVASEEDGAGDDDDGEDDVGMREPGQEDGQDTPAAGAVAVVLAFVGAALLLHRRRA